MRTSLRYVLAAFTLSSLQHTHCLAWPSWFSSSATPSGGGGRLSREAQQKAAADACTTSSAPFKDLYANIAEDLLPWKKSKISSDLMDHTLHYHTVASRKHGIGMMFEDGVPYVISNTSLISDAGHHAGLITAHMMLMEKLQWRFGKNLANVEFVIATSDDPSVLLDPPSHEHQPDPPPPILRFCKTRSHADILIPYIHFNLKHYDKNLLSRASHFSETSPWGTRNASVFGRFSQYKRTAAMDAPETFKEGQGGFSICKPSGFHQERCDVRLHFMLFTRRMLKENYSITMDVAQQPRKSMDHHASYKYLVHLDGQTCSSRLEQLFPLGALVLKEESGYYAFYHRLLKNMTHYVSFWEKRPEDILNALGWAREHDGEAEKIAKAGQEFATKYLHRQAQECYWFMVLQELSKLLDFIPGNKTRVYPELRTVHNFLQARKDGLRWARKYGVELSMFLD